MPVFARIGRFLSLVAWDLLLPDFIDKPLKLAQNFYTCFLAADPADRRELLEETRTLPDEHVERFIDAFARSYQKRAPGAALSAEQRELLRQLLAGLRAA